ncbi:MAG: S41 family peptidase [Myxococcota bacterium]
MKLPPYTPIRIAPPRPRIRSSDPEGAIQRSGKSHATLVATGLFVGGLLCGALAGRAAVARAQDPYAHLDLFARVLTTIQQDYVDPLPTEVLVEAAIRGMIEELDNQSRWLDAEQLQDLRDDAEGTTTGLGIEVAPSDNGVEIVRVLPDSPAQRDGLAEGDRILSVDGTTLAGLDLGTIRRQFSGTRGESTELTVLRSGWEQPRTIATIRDKVHRECVSGAVLPGGLVYTRITQFQEGTAADLYAEVEHLVGDRGLDALDGLIVDLRDNPGGLLTEAVAVSDLFLDDGVIVSTRGREGGEEEVHRATVGGFPAALPVVVLINGMSASASEIVAGALQDTSRGVLVGERSYGKGTVQQVYLHATPDDAALKLTVGRYYTPSGAPVAAAEGRLPDVVVAYPRPPTSLDDLRTRIGGLTIDDAERSELLRLVEAAADEPELRRAQIPWDDPLERRLATDPQLRAAVEALAAR